MAGIRYIVVGRSRDCDLVLEDKSVSGRHARLSWKARRIIVEDLGSANGTFVGGRRVDQSEVRSGDDVRLGSAALPWSDPKLRAFLRAGAAGDTVLGQRIGGKRFICGACGTRGLLPAGMRAGAVRCGSCGAGLVVGRSKRGLTTAIVSLVALAAVGAFAWWMLSAPDPRAALADAVEGLVRRRQSEPPVGSPQEASVRAHTAQKVQGAMDARHPTTRNAAVRVASAEPGPFRLEQVAQIWSHAREEWHYVNDPEGTEYFALASESIDNGYAGDCDDFSIVLAAMIAAVGGSPRVVMMDGPEGGHAYAEVCLHQSPSEVAERLATHYRRTQAMRQGARVDQIHFRSDPACPVWLNLDWNAGVPGGPYSAETWAVAIYPDAHTETLAPAPGSPAASVASGEGASGEGASGEGASAPPAPAP